MVYSFIYLFIYLYILLYTYIHIHIMLYTYSYIYAMLYTHVYIYISYEYIHIYIHDTPIKSKNQNKYVASVQSPIFIYVRKIAGCTPSVHQQYIHNIVEITFTNFNVS